jgi:hypothetical protein
MSRPFRLWLGFFAIAGLHQLVGWIACAADEPSKSAAAGSSPTLVFRDVGFEAGLLPLASGMHAHAAGWGDLDCDEWPDLYVATFHTEGPSNRLFRNLGGRFQLDDQEAPRISTRASGALWVDLDNDGDLDLYVSSMPSPAGTRLAQRIGRTLEGCSLFRNDGGQLTDVSSENGACPAEFGGRSVTALDFDGDGLLDLLVGEDPLPGYNGSPTASSRLFRNLGGLQFEDASRAAGLPADVPGLGVAAGDFTNDGWPDLFLASSGAGGNRLFINDGSGGFTEPPGVREVFAWPAARGDNMVCGVCCGDVNRDGWLDIVLGQHFEKPWIEPVANRLYLNRGDLDGVPHFEDVTERVGLVPLPMKAPHIEIQDFDNDGLNDICTSVVLFAGDEPHPVIFRNLGVNDGLPQFHADALEVNDFPTAEDRAARRPAEAFERFLRERKVFYTAPGPSADFDRDGRLDLFLASWWVEANSLLLRNETEGGNWVEVRVRMDRGVNRMGIGSRVNVYEAGRLGEPDALLCSRETAIGFGYASGQEAIAHFGLGDRTNCDVEVVLPHELGTLTARGLAANQRVTLGR